VKTITRRIVVGVASSALALLGMAVVTTPAQADFTSAIGGDITRSEVMERAQYWVDHQPGSYNQNAYAPDPTNSRDYRRDCSGYVDMAWHTNADYWTGNLDNISTEISRSALKAGDILNSAEEHVILFKSWSNGEHTRFNYYSFGSAPVKLKTDISINATTFDSHPNSHYVARRYVHIKDDAPADVVRGGNDRSYFADDQHHVYERGASNTLRHFWYGDSWSDATLTGSITSDPVSYYVNGQHHVYARNAAGALQHWWYTDKWNTAVLGGAITGNPTAYYAAGQHHVYARTTAGTLYHWWYTADDGWNSASLGGAITDNPTAYYAAGQHHVYARTTAGTLYHWWYTDSWSSTSMGGAITDSPTAYYAAGQHHVYARTTAGTLYHWWYTDSWSSTSLGGAITNSPTAYYADGQHHVYARSATGTLNHWWYADGWSSASLGGAITETPTAYYTGQHHVYARTTTGTLNHWWYTTDDGWQTADLGSL
jgi:hypothetical protein